MTHCFVDSSQAYGHTEAESVTAKLQPDKQTSQTRKHGTDHIPCVMDILRTEEGGPSEFQTSAQCGRQLC